MNLEREIAHDLLSIGAVFLRPDEPFTWASGIKSPIYCDNRLTLTAPTVRTHVEEGLAELVRTHYPEAQVLMGTSTAGIAHAAIVGHLMNLPMGYVRSGNKDHGRQNRIEGRLEKGQKVVVVEDLISKGYLDGSKALVYAAGQDDIAEFAKGEAGFMPGGSWFVAGLDSAAPDMNYTLGGIPVEDDDSLILINAGVRVCINSSSEKKDAARKFVEFFTGLDSMNAYVASQNSFNPRTDGASTDNDVVEPAAERLSAARMVPWVDSAFDIAVVSPWADARTFTANVAGGDSVDNAVKDLNAQVENNLKLK